MSVNVSGSGSGMEDTGNASSSSALEELMHSINGSTLSKIVLYLYPILSIWIVFANGLTLLVYGRYKQLQKKRNVMLISLSAVDLFTGLTQILPKLIARMLGADQSFAICMSAMALQVAPMYASMFHLVTIAIERHVAITKPLLYHALVTPVRLTVALTVNIGVAWFIALIPLAWPRDQFQQLCMSILWFPKAYTYPFVMAPMAATLFTMLLLYVHIYSIARKQETAIAAAASIQNGGQRGPRSLKESRATQVFMFICGIALVCYVPFWASMVLLVVMPNNTFAIYFYYITVIFLHSNSGMNFLVYAFRNSEFRTKLKMLFRQPNDVRNEPTTSAHDQVNCVL